MSPDATLDVGEVLGKSSQRRVGFFEVIRQWLSQVRGYVFGNEGPWNELLVM
jgi:hypothetical protein